MVIDRPGWTRMLAVELWGEVAGLWIYFEGRVKRNCQWIRCGEREGERERDPINKFLSGGKKVRAQTVMKHFMQKSQVKSLSRLTFEQTPGCSEEAGRVAVWASIPGGMKRWVLHTIWSPQCCSICLPQVPLSFQDPPNISHNSVLLGEAPIFYLFIAHMLTITGAIY